ncbi:MAG: type II toxin-antitoxin system HicA family toxin [Clostridiales bacterium]|nr:type II toxin-antitoxin system HicA family toxin [Clostridiales bacterium]
MGQKDKLVKRLKSKPKDFTFEETEQLLGCFGYGRSDKGKTSGSRVKFICNGRTPILLHKPHPRKELLDSQKTDY